jgi:hypothetical protein
MECKSKHASLSNKIKSMNDNFSARKQRMLELLQFAKPTAMLNPLSKLEK